MVFGFEMRNSGLDGAVSVIIIRGFWTLLLYYIIVILSSSAVSLSVVTVVIVYDICFL